jgi:ribonuclease P protein component
VSGAEHIPSAARVSYSFPRSARLLKHAAFDRVYREGRRIFSADFTLFVRRREAEAASGGPRIGFTVSRALGNAVTRNRIKRRMRALARLQMGNLRGPIDVVINPKKTLLKAGFASLQQQVERAFAQLQRPDFSLSAPARNPGAPARFSGGQRTKTPPSGRR